MRKTANCQTRSAIEFTPDIIDAKQMRALTESEELYHAVIELSNDGIAILQDGTFVYVNRRFCQIFKFDSPEEVNGKIYEVVVHSDDQKRIREYRKKRALGSYIPYNYEFKGLRQDGSIVDLEISTAQTQYNGNSIVVAVVRDITERKKTDRALVASEMKYRSLFDAANDGILLMKGQLIVDCNRKAIDLFGGQKDDILRKTIVLLSPEFQPDGSKSKIKAAIKHKMALGSLGFEFDWKFRRLNGTLFDAEVSINRVEIEATLYLQVLIRDITERKKAELSLTDSEQKFRGIFEAIEDLYYETDSRSNITLLSPSIERLTAWQEKDLIGKPISILYADEEDRNLLMDALLKRSFVNDHEITIIKKTGERRVASLFARVIWGNNGRVSGIRGTLRDITPRKKAENELRRRSEAMAASIDGIAILDQNGTYIYVNSAHATMHGFENPDDLIGMTWEQFYSADQKHKFKAEITPILWKHGKWRGECIAARQNGEEYAQEVSLTKVVLEGEMNIIEIIRDITERKRAFYELQSNQKQLSETNTALAVLLRKRENDRRELEERLYSNIREGILPHVEKLKKATLPGHERLVNMIDNNLGKVMSSFPRKIKQLGFTPREIEVASFIRDGKTTKEIADFLCLGIRAIDSHRDNIRKKLGLSGQKINLRSCLMALDDN